VAASWKCGTRSRESKTASTEPGAGATGDAEAFGTARSEAMASVACSTFPPSYRKAETGNSKLREVDPDALDLRVFLQCVVAALAAETRLLVAAEGQAGVVEVVRVDPNRACLQGLGRPERFLDVPRPDGGRETVDRSVADRDRLRLVSERERRQHRPEDLLAGDRHLR